MQRPKRSLKWWLILVGVVVVAGVGVGIWRFRQGSSQAEDLSQIFTVERGDLTAVVASTGEVYAPRQVELSFDVNKLPLIELAVSAGQQVKAGDVMARIDPTELERAVTQAEADLTVAQDSLDKAQNPYTELDLTGAKLAVSQAEVSVEDAKQALEEVTNPDIEEAQVALRDTATTLRSAQAQQTQVESDSPAKIRTLEYEANWYQNNYWEAQVKFNEGKIDQQKLDWEYSNMLAAQEKLAAARAQAENDLASAKNQVAKAWDAYQEAQAELEKRQAGPDPTELAKAQNQVDQAEYNLAKAQADLDKIEAGPDPHDIEVVQAKVVSAQASLEDAQAALKAATMTAPFDGTITSVGAKVGDLVSSSTIVVTLADLANLQVRATVDETDISPVEIGQNVSITFDALPGLRFQGQVLEVPLQGTLNQSVLTYEVPASLEGAGKESLKPGMTANLSIVVGEREDVLLVPILAVQEGEEGNIVTLQDSPQGTTFQTRVEVGLNDGIYVEVKQGLNEGDRVVVEYQSTEQEQFGFGGGSSIMIGSERRMGP
ncbi:MAG: hypothetical protein A2Y73_07785 [Chloroflexi bacterium RBG_13_56_8]|nr:MAG: hypothetical protein A2Y73_07785 [Chloroflexi bacterium RBG_13_56_8]